MNRERGKELMRAVYGWDIEPTKPFEEATVDHLFGEVWAQGDMTIKERRLMLIGMMVGTGQIDVAMLQIDTALRMGELTTDDLRAMVVFLTHYAGWPRGAALNSPVEELIARHEAAGGSDG